VYQELNRTILIQDRAPSVHLVIDATKSYEQETFVSCLERYFTFMCPCIVTNFLIIKPTDALISQIYFDKKLYMFRAVFLPIIRSFPLYIRHCYMSRRFDDIRVYQCRMYSGKLLMTDGETARNVTNFLTK